MPLAPVVIASLIGTAGAVGSQVLAGNGQSSQQKQLIGQQTSNAAAQAELARKMAALGESQAGGASTNPALTTAVNYYKSLAGGGGASATAEAVAPDVSRLHDQYMSAATHINNALQGPARDQALADLIRQHASAVADLTSGPRQAAIGNLAAIGQGETGQGNALLGGASSAYGGSTGSAAAAFNGATITSEQQNQLFNGLGQSFAKLWAPYLNQQKTATAASAPLTYAQNFVGQPNPFQVNGSGTNDFASNYAPPKRNYSFLGGS